MLDIDLSLVILTLVIFLAMIFLLNNIFYKPMLNFMDEREVLIKKDEMSIAKNSDDKQRCMKEIDDIIFNAMDKVAKIRQDALKDIKDRHDEKMKSRKDELERDYNVFMSNLKDEQIELKEYLSAETSLVTQALNAKMTKI